MSRRRLAVRAISVGAVGLGLLLALSLAFASGAELDALRADPIARWSPATETGAPQTPPVVVAEEEGSPSIEFYGPLPTLGDREGAIYTRTFLVPRADALRPFESARRAAQAAGWQLDYPDYLTENSAPDRTWTTVRGTKALPTGVAIVSIELDTAPKLDGEGSRRGTNSLTIMLEHTR